MNTNLLFEFSVNKENNTIEIQREFDANLDLVWKAWTTPELLNQWEGPKPWRSETKTMDFREGGFRLYAMVSPEGEKHWGRIDYKKIEIKKRILETKTFCDENGNIQPQIPHSLWNNLFSEQENKSTVNILIQYENAEHMEAIVKMGFKEGMAVVVKNLDELLSNLKNEQNEKFSI